jgi:hypothetical protein
MFHWCRVQRKRFPALVAITGGMRRKELLIFKTCRENEMQTHKLLAFRPVVLFLIFVLPNLFALIIGIVCLVIATATEPVVAIIVRKTPSASTRSELNLGTIQVVKFIW